LLEKDMATQTAAAMPTANSMEKNGREGRLSTPAGRAAPDPVVPKVEDPGPLQAAHTPNFPALLRHLGASLLVTTYQAGKLVMVRAEGDHLNTHFRSFKAPMAWPWPTAAQARHRHHHPGLGVPRHARRRPPIGARRHA
jgi:hypothetical protein